MLHLGFLQLVVQAVVLQGCTSSELPKVTKNHSLILVGLPFTLWRNPPRKQVCHRYCWGISLHRALLPYSRMTVLSIVSTNNPKNARPT